MSGACIRPLREPAVFFAVYYAIAGRMLYVHPNLLPGVRGLPAELVLSRPALLPVPHKPASRSLEAAAASFVSVCAGLFIPQRQVAPMLSNISPDRSFLFCRLLPRKAMRCAWPVPQAFQRPTISLFPFAHGLSTWPVPVRRCAGSLLCRVFQRPLTIVGCAILSLENSSVVVGCSHFYLATVGFSFVWPLLPMYCTATASSFSLRCKAMIP